MWPTDAACTKGKRNKKVNHFLHFSKLKFLSRAVNMYDQGWGDRVLLEHSIELIYITASVLNSARFDSILFCDKFEINF